MIPIIPGQKYPFCTELGNLKEEHVFAICKNLKKGRPNNQGQLKNYKMVQTKMALI